MPDLDKRKINVRGKIMKLNMLKKQKANINSHRLKHVRSYIPLYMLLLPTLIFYLLFCYKPMYGVLIAFKDFEPATGFSSSPWVGLKHFKTFFESYYFARVMKNTVIISGASILFCFPAPIILALLMNEIKSSKFKKTVQSITYIPHFISLITICGMIKVFTGGNGIVTNIVGFFGGSRESLLNNPDYFVPIYIISDIWQGIGWGTIVYLAALTGVDQELYEAAATDGAGRLRQVWHITLPCILPTIITMFLLRMGSALTVGYEKIILLYNYATYETADVISSFVYRSGLQESQWSFSTAVGLFNSVINLIFLVVSNTISKKLTETSLW